MSIILEPEEIAILTKRDRPAAQARVLRALGIPFRFHPADPVILVSRAAVEAVLSSESIGGMTVTVPALYEVDTEGIRNHGKTSNPR